MHPGLISRTFDPFLSKILCSSDADSDEQRAALTCLEAAIGSTGILEELKTTEVFGETESAPRGHIFSLLSDPSATPLNESNEALTCIAAIAKTYPDSLIDEWESLKPYLTHFLSLPLDRRSRELKTSTLIVLENWMSKYGSLAQ